MYFTIQQDQPNIEIVKYLPSQSVHWPHSHVYVVSYFNGTLCSDFVITIDIYNTCTVCIFFYLYNLLQCIIRR